MKLPIYYACTYDIFGYHNTQKERISKTIDLNPIVMASDLTCELFQP